MPSPLASLPAHRYPQRRRVPGRPRRRCRLRAPTPMPSSSTASSYVIGGTKGAEPFAANEQYDPTADRWRTLAPMPRGIHHQALATVNGKIYAFGGFTAPAHGGPIDVGLEYDPKADSWRTLPKLSSPRGSPSGVGLNGKIHVIGGRGADAVTLPIHEVFDPATNQWSTGAPLPKGRDHAGLIVAEGRSTPSADGSPVPTPTRISTTSMILRPTPGPRPRPCRHRGRARSSPNIAA